MAAVIAAVKNTLSTTKSYPKNVPISFRDDENPLASKINPNAIPITIAKTLFQASGITSKGIKGPIMLKLNPVFS